MIYAIIKNIDLNSNTTDWRCSIISKTLVDFKKKHHKKIKSQFLLRNNALSHGSYYAHVTVPQELLCTRYYYNYRAILEKAVNVWPTFIFNSSYIIKMAETTV